MRVAVTIGTMVGALSVPDGLEPLILTGAIAATAAALLTVTWLVTMIAAPALRVESTGEEELRFIADHDALQVPKFLPTTLVAFSYVPVWLALGTLLWEGHPTAAALAIAFGLLYPATTAIGYWMQYTVVRGLADLAEFDPSAAQAGYEIVGFHGRRTSAAASAVVLGYVVWSFGGTAAGIGLIAAGGGLALVTGLLFLVTAALMFLGAAGHLARNRALEAGVMASGVTSLGATIATAALLFTQL